MKCHFISIAVFFIAFTTTAHAEYCEDQFFKDMTTANTELGNALKWQHEAQLEATKLDSARKLEQDAIDEVTSSTTLTPEVQLAQIKAHNAVVKEINIKLDKLVAENSEKNKRIAALKENVPKDLTAKAQQCAKEIAPLNLVVNLAVQGLALFFTDGASVVLPEKALYIDMGEIVHGNVMGGEHSLPNDIKNKLNEIFDIHL